jgi:hypothetical protein
MIAYGQGVSIEAFGLPPITHLIGAKIGQGRQHQQFFSRAELGNTDVTR